MKHRILIPLATLVVCAFILSESGAAWARAGGGGSRGSRSYSAPARPDSMPSSPSRNYGQPAPAPLSPQRPGLFGGLMGGLAGFALGGLLGSMLFGGMGHGFGIGLLEILLIGAGVVLLMKFMRRRQTGSAQPAYATAGGPAGPIGGYGDRFGANGGGTGTIDPPAPPSDLERGLGHIRQMDARFDPEMFATVARNAFLEVQQAVAQRDVSWLRDRVAPEIYTTLQAQCDRLRAARQTNHVEQIRIHRTQVTEAWQESGRDFVTALIAATLLDYTIDDATGAVVDGSKNTAQNVEEFWTFVRPVGNHPWQLTAIQTA